MDVARFRLIDKLVELNLHDKTIVCETTVPEKSSIYEGHFPGFEVFPGVLQIEAIAQTAGLLVLNAENLQRVPLLFGVDHVRLRKFVKPGSRLRITCLLVAQGSGYAVCGGRADLEDGTTAASADVRFRVMDFPSALMLESVLATARSLCVPHEMAVAGPEKMFS